MNKKRVCTKTALLAAALAAVLIMTAAVAAVMGNTQFRDTLNDEGIKEVADLVQQVHAGDSETGAEGFSFSVDELIWEDDSLYVSYSLSVPEDGEYMVAMYTPTLNGAKLPDDAKGWTQSKFFDSEDYAPAALLLGGDHGTRCTDLWTFSVNPALKSRRDNALHFRAVLLKTPCALVGGGDWTSFMNAPQVISFDRDWRETSPLEVGDAQAALMDDAAAAYSDGRLTLDALVAAGCAEYVVEREIEMDLDGSKLPETVYNDVAERDFDRLGVHVHINRFRMTHLGVEIDYTCSVPGAKRDDADAAAKLNAFAALDWRFCDTNGKELGFSMGGTGGGGINALEDGTPAYSVGWHESTLLPLEGLSQIAFAPCTFVDDPDGGNHPEYDMDSAIVLEPLYSESIAKAETEAAPTPTPNPDDVNAYKEAEFSN